MRFQPRDLLLPGSFTGLCGETWSRAVASRYLTTSGSSDGRGCIRICARRRWWWGKTSQMRDGYYPSAISSSMHAWNKEIELLWWRPLRALKRGQAPPPQQCTSPPHQCYPALDRALASIGQLRRAVGRWLAGQQLGHHGAVRRHQCDRHLALGEALG